MVWEHQIAVGVADALAMLGDVDRGEVFGAHGRHQQQRDRESGLHRQSLAERWLLRAPIYDGVGGQVDQAADVAVVGEGAQLGAVALHHAVILLAEPALGLLQQMFEERFMKAARSSWKLRGRAQSGRDGGLRRLTTVGSNAGQPGLLPV